MSISIIGEIISERRAKLKLTQSQLAARCSISQPLIARIESGTKTDINLNSLKEFARAFGCTGSELLSEIEQREKSRAA